MEIREKLQAAGSQKTLDTDSPSPALIEDGETELVRELQGFALEGLILRKNSLVWLKSIVVPIVEKGFNSGCANHMDISLTPAALELLASTTLRRLYDSREKNKLAKKTLGSAPPIVPSTKL